jgi:Domain of unknown function (DUF4145)
VPPKHVVPSIGAASFSCPHCGALAHQNWYRAHVKRTEGGEPPQLARAEDIELLRAKINKENDPEKKQIMSGWIPDIERRANGLPYLYPEERYTDFELVNVFVSFCFGCKDIALWRYNALVYPPTRHDIEPNPDLDPNIEAIFNEAREVFGTSPRAAAALLRLCLQGLCKQLGTSGRTVDEDIGELVAKGLPVAIQQALDLVRVVGNHAVHPGTINFNDDRATAAKLFELVNLIADNQISQPNAIARLFEDKVPSGAKEAIARRDGEKSST